MKNKRTIFTFWKKNKDIIKIFNALGKDKLYFVGGAVRSAIKGVSCEDLDIAANIESEILKKLLIKNNIKFFDVSQGHGTVNVTNRNFNIEITSFREDKVTYGRAAKIKFTNDIFIDSSRRDFTINAVYSDFNGNLYNPHQGLEDLKKKTIKFIGDPTKRIIEDHLRIIRYFRFIAQYSNSLNLLEKNSLEACIKNKLLIRNISRERISLEFTKLILSENASFSMLLLRRYKIIDMILEGTSRIKELDIKSFDNIHKDFIVRLSYISSKAKISIKQIRKDLRISNKQMKEIQLLTKQYIIVQNTKEARVMKYEYGNNLALKKYKLMTALYKIKENKRVINVIQYWQLPKFPLAGKDLAENGLHGIAIGKILKEIETWWIKTGFKANKAQCLKKIRQY